MKTPLWMDTWTASAHSSSSTAAAAAAAAGSVRVLLNSCWRVGRLNTSTYNTVYSSTGRFIIQ